jgi:hypothetical protein
MLKLLHYTTVLLVIFLFRYRRFELQACEFSKMERRESIHIALPSLLLRHAGGADLGEWHGVVSGINRLP